MALEKRIGFSQTLGVDPAGGAIYVVVGSIVDGWTQDTSVESADTTILSQWWQTVKPHMGIPGTCTFKIAYDPNDTDTQTLVDLLASGDTATWQITFSDEGSGAATETFSGFVEGFSREMTRANLVSAEVAIHVSGDPGFTGGP